MAQVRISSFEGTPGRIIQARLLRDTDLLTGLIAICREHQIQMGVVQCCIGSLRSAKISWVMPADTKRGSMRTPPVTIDGPLEFISGQGTLCALQEHPAVHFHGAVVDPNGRVWGGHFLEGGNPVHSTMDVAIFELCGVGMHWYHDPEIDLEIPVPCAFDR